MPPKRKYLPKTKRQRLSYQQRDYNATIESSSSSSGGIDKCHDKSGGEGPSTSPSLLLYNPQKRLTFPPDQQPPPSDVLRRFTQAFKMANDNAKLRPRSRPSAMNFLSASNHTSKREDSRFVERKRRQQRDDGEDVKDRKEEEEALALPRHMKREASLDSIRKAFTSSDIGEGSSSRRRNDKDSNYSISCSDEAVLARAKNPMSAIQRSLPPFLSDITVPTNEHKYAPSSPISSRKPFPMHLYAAPSSPNSRSRASTVQPQSILKDNIWSRQEQTLGLHDNQAAHRSLYGSHNNGISSMDVHSTSNQFLCTPAQNLWSSHIKKEDDGLYDFSHRNVEDDGSSNEFVYNRHTSPDWTNDTEGCPKRRANHQRGTYGRNFTRLASRGRSDYEEVEEDDYADEQMGWYPRRTYSDISL